MEFMRREEIALETGISLNESICSKKHGFDRFQKGRILNDFWHKLVSTMYLQS